MAEQSVIDDFLAQKVFAVVGASREPDKYGFKVFRSLKGAGYTAYAVNPKCDSLLGEKCYTSVGKAPQPIDVVSMIVPPHEGEKVVEEAAELGIKRIWFQPGAESEKLLAMCEEKGITVLSGVCVMIEAKKTS